MARRGAVVSLVALVLAGPARTTAQSVRGTVRDSATGRPIAGAVVSLTDSAGRFLARSIGNDSGHFAVVRLPGASMLHLVRIGYHPRDIALRAALGDAAVVVKMSAVPPFIAAVATSKRRVCSSDQGNSQALELWDQVRAALLASVVARETHPPQLYLLSFDRTLDPVRRRLLDASNDAKTVTGDRSYMAARPAWAFANEGYMIEEHGGDRTFFAPDEEVLLDPTFAGTHCLHVVSGEKATHHAGQFGIGFEPIHDENRDTLVDVRGVLWLASANTTISSLEFQYTSLEPNVDAGTGEITFRLTPAGAPMIQSWIIRSAMVVFDAPPLVNGVQRSPPPRWQRTNVRIIGYHEVGGSVAYAEWP